MNRVLVNADAGLAFGSTCVPRFADLGACPAGNALQCVRDAGWFGCQSDAGWAALGSSGGASSGVSSVAGTAPIQSSGGASPTISCVAASGAQNGCLLSTDFSTFAAKESALTFTAPLSRSTNTITCTPASNVVGGCLTSGTQSIAGYKELVNGGQADDLFQFTGSFPRTVNDIAFNVSQINYQGIMVGTGPIAPTFGGNSITLMGARDSTDLAPDVIVKSSSYRDAGGYFAVLDGPNNGQVFAIDAAGNVKFNYSDRYSKVHNTEPAWLGLLQDQTGLSGHIALSTLPGMYLAIGGRLADDRDAIESDGGCPLYDGGEWVLNDGGTGVGADGGVCLTYYSYAGNHGDLSVIPHGPHVGGWLLELKNPTSGTASDSKFAIDPLGGMVQPGGLVRAKFPPESVAFRTSVGQFSYGVGDGTQYYATGSGEHRWFWYDLGTHKYQQVAQQAPVFLKSMLLNTSAAVGTIDAMIMPSSDIPLLDALHVYVGAAGTGGTTDVIFRATDGTLSCDFHIACNTAPGPRRITSADVGCTSMAAGSTITWSINQTGDCGVKTVFTGNVTPEARWR